MFNIEYKINHGRGQISGCLNSTYLKLKLFILQGKLFLLFQGDKHECVSVHRHLGLYFASRKSLYTETCQQTLQNRQANMFTMFKIYNGCAPPSLNYIISYKHENVSSYNTRNKKTPLYLDADQNYLKRSFVPGSLRLLDL